MGLWQSLASGEVLGIVGRCEEVLHKKHNPVYDPLSFEVTLFL
jgi:hypothetical protein